MNRRATCFLFLSLVLAAFSTAPGLDGVLLAQEAAENRVLLRGYRELQLGLQYADVQELLRSDPNFSYRGEPDLSMAPGGEQQVIDTPGSGFIDRGLFQFQNGMLYIIALYLDRQRLDYFRIFDQLQRRYGRPQDLDPNRAIWQDNRSRIELERPLTVRYLDLETFEARRRERRTLEAIEETLREQFIDDF